MTCPVSDDVIRLTDADAVEGYGWTRESLNPSLIKSIARLGSSSMIPSRSRNGAPTNKVLPTAFAAEALHLTQKAAQGVCKYTLALPFKLAKAPQPQMPKSDK